MLCDPSAKLWVLRNVPAAGFVMVSVPRRTRHTCTARTLTCTGRTLAPDASKCRGVQVSPLRSEGASAKLNEGQDRV